MENGVWWLQLREFSTYETFLAPTWADVETVFRRLDGFRHDDASLDYLVEGVVVAYLILGGGEDGRVVVCLHLTGAAYPLHLIDPAQGEARVTQSVGGQETPLPGKFYAPLEMALQAASYFYQHLAADPTLLWVAAGA